MQMATLKGSLNLIKLHSSLFRFSANLSRGVVSQTSSNGSVFDKNLRIKHLDRSSLDKDAHVYDYVKDHFAKDVCDRIDDLKDKECRTILNIGSCSGLVSRNLNNRNTEIFIQTDISKESLRRCRRLNGMIPTKTMLQYIHCDSERIPLRSNSMDLVISCLDLHWVDDLVSCFRKIRDTLRDDCPFIGAIFGGDSLYELRSSIQLAEMERLSGISCHMSPKTTGQDIANLLQTCGFQLITVDVEEIKICYPSMFELMFDLQGMGENNASLLGSKHIHRDVLKSSAAIYQYLYGNDDTGGGVPATFQAIHFIGWKNPSKATPIQTNNAD